MVDSIDLCSFPESRLVTVANLLARDEFFRTNRHAITMMFLRLSVRLSVRPSVWGGRVL